MGNSIFGRLTRGTARRFRPRMERLEHRLHLAGDLNVLDVNVFDLNQGALGSLPADTLPLPAELVSPPKNHTVLQQNVFVDEGQFLSSVSLAATPSVTNSGELDLVVTTMGLQAGELVRNSQIVDPSKHSKVIETTLLDDQPFDLPAHTRPDSSPPVADHPTAEWAPSSLSTASQEPRSASAGAVDVLATRYSTELTSESIDFSAQEIAASVLRAPDSGARRPWGTRGFEPPEAVAMSRAAILLPADGDQSSQALSPADTAAETEGLQSTLPATVFAQPLDVESFRQNPRCLPRPETPESKDNDDTRTLDAATDRPVDSEQDADERKSYQRLASQMVHSVCKAKLIPNLQECAWMDVLVGDPIGRLSMLNGFDVFRELQTDAVVEPTTTPDTRLLDVLHYGVLMIGVGAAGLVILRSSLPRKRNDATDAVFGSSIHLDETLAPPV